MSSLLQAVGSQVNNLSSSGREALAGLSNVTYPSWMCCVTLRQTFPVLCQNMIKRALRLKV